MSASAYEGMDAAFMSLELRGSGIHVVWPGTDREGEDRS
jgi:hypothetical protein